MTTAPFRVRVPGGTLSAAQLRTLAAAARDLGDGALELTGRGNLLLAGTPAGAAEELANRLAAAGLRAGAIHARVPDVLVSTLSGRAPRGAVDVRPWPAAFDSAVRADPGLAELPASFLAAFDDGRGDVAGLGADVSLLALHPATVALVLGGTNSGLRAHPDDAVALALAATRAFVAERSAQGGAAERLAELTDGPDRVAVRLAGEVGPLVPVPAALAAGPVGAVTQNDGRTALIGLLPRGRIDAAQAEVLTRVADEVQLTPWRSVVVPDLAEDAVDDVAVDLFRAGLVFDEAGPWAAGPRSTTAPR